MINEFAQALRYPLENKHLDTCRLFDHAGNDIMPFNILTTQYCIVPVTVTATSTDIIEMVFPSKKFLNMIAVQKQL